MLRSKKRLAVVVNPFAAPLDEEGRPCVPIQYDPTRTAGIYIPLGCTRHEKVEEKRPRGDARGNRVRFTWTYDVSPKEIEDTDFHRGLLAEGTLFAANEATARHIGAKFEEPGLRLRRACADAVVAWAKDHFGQMPDGFGSWFSGEKPVIENWPAMPGSALAKERQARADKAKADAAADGEKAKNEPAVVQKDESPKLNDEVAKAFAEMDRVVEAGGEA